MSDGEKPKAKARGKKPKSPLTDEEREKVDTDLR